MVIESEDEVISRDLELETESQIQPTSPVRTSASVCGYRGSSFEIIVTSSWLPRTVTRTYGDFEVLHQKICNRLAQESKENEELPVLPVLGASSDDAAMTLFCGNLNSYLQNELISTSTELYDMLSEECSNGQIGKLTAIDFVLQPFDYEEIYVARGSKYEVTLQVAGQEDVVVWKFEIEDHDIEFIVSFQPEAADVNWDRAGDLSLADTIHRPTRYNKTMAMQPVQGMYTCPSSGSVTLTWNNTYSRIRGKNILYLAEVVSSQTMKSAILAADALAEAVKLQLQSGDSDVTELGTVNKVEDPTVNEISASNKQEFQSGYSFTGSWLVNGTVAVAGAAASRLFGGGLYSAPSGDKQSDAGEYVQQLNALNTQLMKRVESLEDQLAEVTVRRDSVISECNVLRNDVQAAKAQLFDRESEIMSLKCDLERFNREREAWTEIQAERDELLIEKHRWAISDEFEASSAADIEAKSPRSELCCSMDSATIARLDEELRLAEASVLSLRAQLGYTVSNHVTGTSNRLELLARELAKTKKAMDEKILQFEPLEKQLREKIVKYRAEKQVLVTALRNMKRQTEAQVAVALSEASEARMVNKRLRRQNDLLLGQIRSLVDAETKKSSEAPQPSLEANEIPYTLTPEEIALLSGRGQFRENDSLASKSDRMYRVRLEEFFKTHDPDRLEEIDQLLDMYRGEEDALFDALALKYGFNHVPEA